MELKIWLEKALDACANKGENQFLGGTNNVLQDQ